jgi:hypothetical protein
MRRYRFDRQTAQARTDFGSRGLYLTRLAAASGLSVVCIYLEAGGMLARHAAAENQLFCVVNGAGEVSGDTGVFLPVQAGLAAFWERGEYHETRSDTGLTAFVLEGPDLDPSQFLQPIEPG